MVNLSRYLFLIFIFFVLHSFSFAQQETSQRATSQKELYQKESSRIQKLSKGADVIITGKVTQKKSSWNDNKTRIFTRTTVQVDEYLKGQSKGDYVEITSPGGEVGDVGELYTHMPRFEDNEEVLVFLQRDKKNNGYKVFNGEEGKITVMSDAQTKEKVTRSNMRVNALKSQIKSFLKEE